MSEKQVQVNIRLAESSADRLKSLAESTGLKIGAFVERMITAYSDDSNLLQNDSKVGSWESVADELRGMIADQDVRLNRIETAILSGLTEDGRDAMARVSIETAESEAVDMEIDSPSRQVDPSPLPPKEQLSPEDFEALVKHTYKEAGYTLKKTIAMLRAEGYSIGQQRLYRILGLKKD